MILNPGQKFRSTLYINISRAQAAGPGAQLLMRAKIFARFGFIPAPASYSLTRYDCLCLILRRQEVNLGFWRKWLMRKYHNKVP